MIYEIIKILPPKKSRNGDTSYLRIEFKDEEGNWLKTDLCSKYRNWDRWQPLLKPGNRLFNLELKDKNTINADSFPSLLNGRRENKGLSQLEIMEEQDQFD